MTDRFIAYIERERRYSPLTVRNYRHDIECFAAWWCDYYGRQEFAPAEVTARVRSLTTVFVLLVQVCLVCCL